MQILRKIGEKIMMVIDIVVDAKLTRDRMVAESMRRHWPER
jgi:queuine/archaeosine tRNA-ribosyltransferase